MELKKDFKPIDLVAWILDYREKLYEKPYSDDGMRGMLEMGDIASKNQVLNELLKSIGQSDLVVKNIEFFSKKEDRLTNQRAS